MDTREAFDVLSGHILMRAESVLWCDEIESVADRMEKLTTEMEEAPDGPTEHEVLMAAFDVLVDINKKAKL